MKQWIKQKHRKIEKQFSVKKRAVVYLAFITSLRQTIKNRKTNKQKKKNKGLFIYFQN